MRPVVLVGPPGSGKTTLAPRVAARLGVPWEDVDRAVEARAGRTVAEVFARDGEGAFRALEREVFRALLARGGVVIAAGGGTLVPRALRHEALRRALVVGLEAPPEVLLARLGDAASRPLLARAGSPREALSELLDLRRDAYAEVHLRLDTARAPADALADAVARAHGADPLAVPVGAATYGVRFAPLASLGEALGDALGGRPASAFVLVTDANVAPTWGRAAARALPGKPRATVVLAPGERAKTLASVKRIWDAALGAGIDRDAVVVGVGGGVVTDLAGFAAATLLRGVRCVALPTTVLAMADAAVGGKTGFDHATGKNLVGAFHQPSLVLADVATLATLPPRERVAGLAEVVKVALACDAALLATLERDAAALASDPGALARALRAAVRAKIDVVAEDPREGGRRGVLNLGHTVGHAIEAASGYRLRHGECVAVGTVAELRLGAALGVTAAEVAPRAAALFCELGLPTSARVRYEDARGYLASDKKRAGGALRCALVEAPGCASVRTVERRRVLAALRSVLETRAHRTTMLGS